jgi:hypothetical protein
MSAFALAARPQYLELKPSVLQLAVSIWCYFRFTLKIAIETIIITEKGCPLLLWRLAPIKLGRNRQFCNWRFLLIVPVLTQGDDSDDNEYKREQIAKRYDGAGNPNSIA